MSCRARCRSLRACGETSLIGPSCPRFVLPHSEKWRVVGNWRRVAWRYYHTKSKPDSVIIPLTVLQNSALSRRHSRTLSSTIGQTPPPLAAAQEPRPMVHHSRSYKSLNTPPTGRNLTTDSHLSIPLRLVPALPPVPFSEANTLPTPTHSHPLYHSPQSPGSYCRTSDANAAIIARYPEQHEQGIFGT
ncbi:hypothetical protein EDB87DRAFT_1357923 [Lactarius vividus]|nr:hypothetical protein EDB87DRAFT_1357923 [Lactarius vividus]